LLGQAHLISKLLKREGQNEGRFADREKNWVGEYEKERAKSPG